MLVAPEPADLAARISAGQRLGLRDRVRLVELAPQLRECLRIADRARRGHTLLDAGRSQPGDLVDQPGGPHALDALVEPANEKLARSRETEDERGMPEPRRLGQGGSVSRLGELVDLERTYDTPTVRRIDPRGGRRVDGSEPGEQRPRAVLRELGLKARAHLAVAPGEPEVVDDARDVQAGATDEDRQCPSCEHRFDRRPRVTLIGRDARLLRDIEHIEEVVRNTAPLSERDLGRADVHAAVELHRVGVDDLGALAALAQERGRPDRQLGLAGAGCADDDEERRARHAQRSSSFGS